MIRTILLIIFEFMKTGLMAVGGGMACIRFLQDMIAKYGWITGVFLWQRAFLLVVLMRRMNCLSS